MNGERQKDYNIMAKIIRYGEFEKFTDLLLEKSPYVFDSDVEEPEDYEPTLGNVYVEDDSMI